MAMNEQAGNAGDYSDHNNQRAASTRFGEELIGDNDLNSFGTDGISERMNRNNIDDFPAANPGFGEGFYSTDDLMRQSDDNVAIATANDNDTTTENPTRRDQPRSGESMPSDNSYTRSGDHVTNANNHEDIADKDASEGRSAWEKIKNKAENFGDDLKRAFE